MTTPITRPATFLTIRYGVPVAGVWPADPAFTIAYPAWEPPDGDLLSGTPPNRFRIVPTLGSVFIKPLGRDVETVSLSLVYRAYRRPEGNPVSWRADLETMRQQLAGKHVQVLLGNEVLGSFYVRNMTYAYEELGYAPDVGGANPGPDAAWAQMVPVTIEMIRPNPAPPLPTTPVPNGLF